MRKVRPIVLVSVMIAAACLPGCGRGAPAGKLIVLGVDGMDPGFIEKHWSDLPNLSLLRDRGSFHRLQTTTPPQSPVAWSTFITGLEPDEHGIFDFVHRDPVTLQPFSSLAKTEPARWSLPLGPYRKVLLVETVGVRALASSEVSWRIRPIAAMAGELRVQAPGNVQSKRVVAGLSGRYFTPLQGSSKFARGAIKTIEVAYPQEKILGFTWTVWFFGLMSLTALVATRR